MKTLRDYLGKTGRDDNQVPSAPAPERGGPGTNTRLKITTFNTEQMSIPQLRLHIHTMEQDKIDILILQGTRWKASHNMTINKYLIINNPAKPGIDPDSHTGTSIVFSPRIHTHNHTVHIVQEGRILATRIKTSSTDFIVIAAHAPGEHHPEQDKKQFWKHLSHTQITHAHYSNHRHRCEWTS
jgi:exonuclease III